MSLANSNSQGNKKKNMPWQFRMLKVLGSVASAVAPIAGLATEATLQSVLAALQDGQDFEQHLVYDDGVPDPKPTYLEVRIWNPDTQTFDAPIYYDATGAVVVPIDPKYVNPQYTLEDILLQVTATAASVASIDADTTNILADTTAILADTTAIAASVASIDITATNIFGDTTALLAWTTAGQQLSAASAPVVLSTEQEAILSAIAASTAQIDLDVSDVLLAIGVSNGHLTNLVTWTSAGQLASAASAPVVLSTEQEAILDAIKTAVEAINLDTDGLAQEATLLATNALLTTIDAVLDAIKIDTSNLDTPLSNVEANTAPATGLTPSLSRVTDAVGVLAGARSVSFYNAGTADVTVAGDVLKQGEMVTFDAGGINNTLGAIAYDATGGGGRELVITEVR